MDAVLDFLCDYGDSLSYAELSPTVVHQVKRCVIDALGCAMGAYLMTPPKIASAYALEVTSRPGATVLATLHKSAPELAAFANGVMVRYLDFNDSSAAGNTGHPSDNIMAVLAAAEYVGADMKTAIAAIVLAYEVQNRLGAVSRQIRLNGWDHAVYVVLSSAAGASKAMGLSKSQTSNALSLAIVPHAAMGQTRVGQFSMWKGCSAPNATRNGVFASLMAQKGLTGPENPFTGSKGFEKQLGTTLKLPTFGGKGVPFTIETVKFKYYPCDYEAQCSITPALELHSLLNGQLDDIQKISIETYENAVRVAANSSEKWNPTSRETADHSIPYVVAVALTRGRVWLDDFVEERFRDPDIHSLMQKIEVRWSEELNRNWPEEYPFRISVTKKTGEILTREIRYAKGHPKNPMDDRDIDNKFRKLTSPIMKSTQIDEALDHLWHLDEMKNIGDIFALFALN